MRTYTVIVGNIGTVYRGGSKTIATKVFDDSVTLGRMGGGRAGNEPVTLCRNGEPIREHTPPCGRASAL